MDEVARVPARRNETLQAKPDEHPTPRTDNPAQGCFGFGLSNPVATVMARGGNLKNSAAPQCSVSGTRSTGADGLPRFLFNHHATTQHTTGERT
jgi:hypothetical protein